MRNKKIIAFIILGIAAVISLIYGIVASSSGRRAASSLSSAGPEPKGNQAASNLAYSRRLAKRTRFEKWKRSPFIPKSAPGTSSGLVLSGIVWSDKNPKAMIGDAIVKKGDKIGENTVIEIKKDRVVLNDGTQNLELRMKE